MAKYSEAQKKAVAKYNAKAYDEIKVRVSKGSKAVISDYSASKGISTNKLINELLECEIPELKALKNKVPVISSGITRVNEVKGIGFAIGTRITENIKK